MLQTLYRQRLLHSSNVISKRLNGNETQRSASRFGYDYSVFVHSSDRVELFYSLFTNLYTSIFFFVICIHKNQCCLCCFLIYSFYSFIFILLQESIDVSFQCLTTMYGVDIRLAHITQRTTTTINDASPHQVLRTTTAPSTWKIGLAEKYTC